MRIIATRDTITAWEKTLDEIRDLHSEVEETLCDPPEPHQDLSLALLEGDRSGTTRPALRTRPRLPAPLPGGDKLAAIGPYSADAPEDDFPHPGLIIHRWVQVCAAEARAIPPRPAWDAEIAYLRARVQYIPRDYEEPFTADLRRVRGLLAHLCHVDRLPRAAAVACRLLRGMTAQDELRERIAEIPLDFELTRDEAAILWPAYARDECEMQPDTQQESPGLRAWKRARERQDRGGDVSGRGRIMAYYLNV